MRAIRNNIRAVFPVDVANQGNVTDFAPQDAVELPCRIDATGAHPLSFGALPASK